MKAVRRKPLKGNIRIPLALAQGDRELMVWSYGGVTKNHRAKSVPNVVVFFRYIDQSGVLGPFTRRSVAATHLGLLRAGTIWKEDKLVADTDLQTERFDVDFTNGSWGFTSSADCAERDSPCPINQNDFPLYFVNDKNWMLDFPLGDGKNLLIPCLEFLIRYYGRSQEISRDLLTYPWSEVERRFYAPFDQEVRSGAWPIKLTKRLRNGDVVFLAHAKYDSYTQRIAKSIYSQVETSFLNHEPYAFLKVAPWFQGPAEFRVSGWWINGGRTFLGLRIKGGSDPQGKIIQRDRENSNKTNQPAEGEGEGKAWDGAPEKILKKLPEIVDLTDADEPDHGAPTIEIEEEEFEQLGIQRVVIDVRRDQAKTSSGTPRSTEEPGKFSTGDPYGDGKGVGKASIHARPMFESHGVLRDMWNAMLHLKKTRPNLISTVEWFSPDKGFISDDEPELIVLKPFDADVEGLSTEARRWPYYDVSKKIPRGILVARITVRGKLVHIVEVQRKPTKRKGEDGTVKDAEETFKGLVFVLPDNNGLAEWIERLRSRIRYVNGVVTRLVGDCPGVAAAFKHPPPKSEQVLCEAAILNALEKVGIDV